MCNREVFECARCGAGIVHRHVYEGKDYGRECIKAVLGFPVPTSIVDVDDYVTRRKEREARDTQTKAQYLERVRRFSVENEWIIGFLRDQSVKRIWSDKKQQYLVITDEYSFAYSVSKDLESRSIDDLSDKVFNIVLDLWAKVNGGRRGSKAYQNAVNEFFDRIESNPAPTATPRLTTQAP
jgi:hypothetical protein